MEQVEPYRVSTALAWRRGIPAAYWLEDYPHSVLWDSDFYLASIRTLVIDGPGPRRPDVHDLDEAEACRDLSVGALAILACLAEARLATAALEADESLDYDAPELLAAYALEDEVDRQFHEYFGTTELGAGRAVVAFGPAAPFGRFLQTTTGGS